MLLKFIYSGFFMFAGIMHILKPKIFKNFTPSFLPLKLANYAAGIVEFSIGLALLFTSTIKYGAIGIFILMVIFLPIHFWDAAKTKPAIGNKTIAYIRIPIQFLLMYGAYLIYINA